MQFTESTTPRGTMFTLTKGELRSGVHLPPLDALGDLAAANRSFGEQIARIAATYQPARQPEVIATVAGPIIKATKAAIGTGQNARRDLAERKARLRTRPATLSDKSNDAEIRAPFRDGDIDKQIRGAEQADLRTLAALVAEGNLAELAEPAFEIAERRYIALAHLERSGMAADFQRRPTLGKLTATGVDLAAAEAAATELAAQINQADSDLDAIEHVLQNQIVMLGIALDLSPSKVLERVLAA